MDTYRVDKKSLYQTDMGEATLAPRDGECRVSIYKEHFRDR